MTEPIFAFRRVAIISAILLLPMPMQAQTLAGPLPEESFVAAAPGQNGMIAFVAATAASNATEIFRINADGSALRQLTSTPQRIETELAWSPDGRLIAFQRGRCVDKRLCYAYKGFIRSHLYTMNAYGRKVTKIKTGGFSAEGPAWSPDGRHIAFERYRNDQDWSIWIKDMETGTQTRTGLVGHDAAWSPTGDSLLYVIGQDIWTAGIDGSNKVNLTSSEAPESSPSWSPSGNEIVFARHSGEENTIHVMDSDGAGQRKVAEGEHPSWSPDGTRIAFRCTRRTPRTDLWTPHICSMTPAGKDITALTPEDADWSFPEWGSHPAQEVKDRIPPRTRVKGKYRFTTKRRHVTLRFTSNERGASFECWLDTDVRRSYRYGGGPCRSPVTYRGLDPGLHVFFVRATDRAGNTDRSTAVAYWLIED